MAAGDDLVYNYYQNQNRQPGRQYALGAGSPTPDYSATNPAGDLYGNTGPLPNYGNPGAINGPVTDVGYDPNYNPTPMGMTTKVSGQGPAGIDPALWAIYQKAGVTPGERGSGFADWQYWQDKGPSQYARLTADLAGTGTDQPTGTPGTGPWQNSGRNVPPPSGSGPVSGGVIPYGGDARAIPVGGGAPIGPMGMGAGSASDLYNYLMTRAQQGLDVSNDLVVKAQTDAFRANEDRSVRNAVASAAERRGANSNIDAVTRSMTEAGATATSTAEASFMQHEVDARRQEIQQALQLGANLLTEEQRQQLQLELEQLNIASNQFMQLRDLQERGFEFDTNNANTVGLS